MPYSRKLHLDLWDGIWGVPVSLSRGAIVWGSDKNKLNSLVDLASAIIDPYYMKIKNESNKDRNA